jgi:hypothetical protein
MFSSLPVRGQLSLPRVSTGLTSILHRAYFVCLSKYREFSCFFRPQLAQFAITILCYISTVMILSSVRVNSIHLNSLTLADSWSPTLSILEVYYINIDYLTNSNKRQFDAMSPPLALQPPWALASAFSVS